MGRFLFLNYTAKKRTNKLSNTVGQLISVVFLTTIIVFRKAIKVSLHELSICCYTQEGLLDRPSETTFTSGCFIPAYFLLKFLGTWGYING